MNDQLARGLCDGALGTLTALACIEVLGLPEVPVIAGTVMGLLVLRGPVAYGRLVGRSAEGSA